MSEISTIYKISVFAFTLCFVYGSACLVLECWFVQEKPGHGGGLSTPMSQEKSLMFISTEAYSEEIKTELHPPADISSSRVYYVTDPAGTFRSAALNPPKRSVNKPKCEINPFMPHASMVRWASALTDSAQSPVYLQADWFSVAAQGIDEQLTLSNIMRASSASKDPKVILSVSSKTPVVRCRLGEPVLLDCGFWIDPSSPLHGSGFSIEWLYQFRGEGRLVLAYDGKNDRFAETSESGAEMDITGLYQTGNASLILEESQVRHSGTYICTSYLPHLLAQVAVDLEIVEPPSLSILPSPLPLLIPGQVLSVQCEASGFVPHTLDLDWEFIRADGMSRSLGQGSVTGHRRASDGTFSQSSRLELDFTKLRLAPGGEISCVAKHDGGTRRASAVLTVIGVGAPSIEDSMAMVAVALLLYGMIKFFSWTFSSSDVDDSELNDKKEK
ncbi:tapasin-like [Danio aesculapii]|uniref:tapasin-like n=1 Tax=Danio aesculapii TaxID=1142201 RepID=UPI0024BF5761|nr:tapasin-like [Danio aesculapii]